MTIVVVFPQYGWHIAQYTRKCDGRRSFYVALASAAHVLHIDHAVTARACRGVATMPALAQHSASELLAWVRGGSVVSIGYYPPEGGHVANCFPARILAYALEGVYIVARLLGRRYAIFSILAYTNPGSKMHQQ